MSFNTNSWSTIVDAVSSAVQSFIDSLKAFAARIIGRIIDGINWAFEKVSEAIVSLLREDGIFYKIVRVYIKNTRTGDVEVESSRTKISKSDVPNDIKFYGKSEVRVARTYG